jgi:hypothetical protein
MALGDQVGKIAVDEINSTTLPEMAKLFTDSLTQVAVIANGAINGLEGERLLAMQALKDEVIAPLIAESQAWRAEVSRLCNILERVSLKP